MAWWFSKVSWFGKILFAVLFVGVALSSMVFWDLRFFDLGLPFLGAAGLMLAGLLALVTIFKDGELTVRFLVRGEWGKWREERRRQGG